MSTHAEKLAQAALRAADVHTLLTKAYALTHRMTGMPRNADAEADVRAQRDLITAEIERRCAAASQLVADFTRAADPSTDGVWREAVDLLTELHEQS